MRMEKSPTSSSVLQGYHRAVRNNYTGGREELLIVVTCEFIIEEKNFILDMVNPMHKFLVPK